MATFSMNAMIGHNVPWWFSQKYELRVVDAEGIVLGGQLAAGREQRWRQADHPASARRPVTSP